MKSGHRNYHQHYGHAREASGFSLLELIMVVLVTLVLAAFATPKFINMLHAHRLNGAVADFAGLIQIQRLRAVDDDRYYSLFVLAPGGSSPQEAFVDVAGTGGATYTCTSSVCDPLVTIPNEVIRRPLASAPNTANLKQQFLPANSPVVPVDGITAGTPITIGPGGLPCTPTTVTGGTVCDSLGGPTAYWTFFQNTTSQSWGAITVTPAGRIQRWLNSGGAAGIWASY